MDERLGSPCRAARDAAMDGWVLGRYFALVVPRARAELRRWRRAADAIEDDDLRADTLGEQPGCESPAAGARLFRLLETAVTPGAAIDTEGRGGRYAAELAATCQGCVAELPSASATLPAILRAVRRCGEGQSFTHAAVHEGPARFAAWCSTQQIDTELEWWEVAGAAISSLAVHALFAVGAMPHVSRCDVDRVDAAYFPWACALSTLLDSTIDRAEDAAAERPNHRVLSYYRTDSEAAGRVALVAARAIEEASTLPRRRTHETIVLGIAAWYLSAPGAASAGSAEICEAVTRRLGRRLGPPLAGLRLRRRLSALAPHGCVD